MLATVIIPARLAATRFPGKPLAQILGKPMIQWVYERCLRSSADRVIVATDSADIYRSVLDFGGECRMTSTTHENGSQRIAEVAAELDTDWVVNVQGDEPTIRAEAIDMVLGMLAGPGSPQMATLVEPILDPRDIFNPNTVKVVLDRNRRAVYFSRAPIPYRKHAGMNGPSWPEPDCLGPGPETNHYRHVGIYGYRKSFLLDYVREPPCTLEIIEGLEQLRALYMGAAIQVEISNFPSIGVDTPADLERAERFLKNEESRL